MELIENENESTVSCGWRRLSFSLIELQQDGFGLPRLPRRQQDYGGKTREGYS